MKRRIEVHQGNSSISLAICMDCVKKHFSNCFFLSSRYILNLPVQCISVSCIKITSNLIFYFHTSLWCLKRFYEGLKSLYKTFWGTPKKYENENFQVIFFLRSGSELKGLRKTVLFLYFFKLSSVMWKL